MVGDRNDMLRRLRAVLPTRWFPDAAPVLDGLLAGLARTAADSYGLVAYARRQTRIATASAAWLDLVAGDLFGARLQRATGEDDATLRARIGRETFRSRATRDALVRLVTEVTGRAPTVFEPRRPADTGAWGVALAYAGRGAAGVGGWGSLALPFQCFVAARRPHVGGIPGVAGYGGGPGGYGRGSIEYADATVVTGSAADRRILAAIAEVLPAGTTAWTRITG